MVWYYVLFFVIALKIPTVWLCWVVWWAIKAKPDHESGGSSGGYERPGPDSRGPTRWRPGGRVSARDERRARRSRPHATPERGPAPIRVGAHAEKADAKETA